MKVEYGVIEISEIYNNITYLLGNDEGINGYFINVSHSNYGEIENVIYLWCGVDYKIDRGKILVDLDKILSNLNMNLNMNDERYMEIIRRGKSKFLLIFDHNCWSWVGEEMNIFFIQECGSRAYWEKTEKLSIDEWMIKRLLE